MCVNFIKICQVVFKYWGLKVLKSIKSMKYTSQILFTVKTCKCTVLVSMCSIHVKEHAPNGIQF